MTSTMNGYTLRVELKGYPNYGAKDGMADILYANETCGWTFPIPSTPIKSAKIVASLILTDDASLPPSDYTLRLWSGSCVYDNATSIPHGTPPATIFNNWVQVTEPAAPTPNANFVVTLSNTSTLATRPVDWFGIDWIELQVVTQ
jgi:hypothetical protein